MMHKRSKTQKWNDTHKCTTKIVEINNTDAQMTHGLKNVLNHYSKLIKVKYYANISIQI